MFSSNEGIFDGREDPDGAPPVGETDGCVETEGNVLLCNEGKEEGLLLLGTRLGKLLRTLDGTEDGASLSSPCGVLVGITETDGVLLGQRVGNVSTPRNPKSKDGVSLGIPLAEVEGAAEGKKVGALVVGEFDGMLVESTVEMVGVLLESKVGATLG